MAHYLLITLSCLLSFSAFAEYPAEDLRLYSPEQIRKITGPAPVRGSKDEKKDFEIILHFQKMRTQDECKVAAAQESASLESLFATNKGPLTITEARALNFRFARIYAETGANIMLAKRLFKRPRPYLTNKEVKPCIAKESSDAYPSGHATMGRVFARILSKMYPHKAKAFMQRSDEIGLNRVLGGVHHPSDIIAGNKLGDALAHEFLITQDRSFND